MTECDYCGDEVKGISVTVNEKVYHAGYCAARVRRLMELDGWIQNKLGYLRGGYNYYE